MPLPVEFFDDRTESAFAEVSDTIRFGQDCVLNGGGEQQQVHDLGDAGTGEGELSGGIHVVFGPTRLDGLLDLMGEDRPVERS